MTAAISRREAIGQLLAAELQPRTLVNIGVGLPAIVPNFVSPDAEVIFHAEHGVIGIGPMTSAADWPGERQAMIFGERHYLVPGAAIVDHADSFALVRSGRLDAAILGAFEVDSHGRVANARLPSMALGGVGGAPEIGAGARRLIVAMEHTTAKGASRLVSFTELDVISDRRADLVVTQYGCFEPAGGRFLVTKLAPGVARQELIGATDAELVFA
jgi:3-oxoacid CoA-transferase B subunit